MNTFAADLFLAKFEYNLRRYTELIKIELEILCFELLFYVDSVIIQSKLKILTYEYIHLFSISIRTSTYVINY
jgi:hypothetical protein